MKQDYSGECGSRLAEIDAQIESAENRLDLTKYIDNWDRSKREASSIREEIAQLTAKRNSILHEIEVMSSK